ncbi:Rossmann fold nucleotide-binding protein [Nocardioides bigeumensis]|uniref:LOG family protein n=1 Tax=Nocardioides bigeumensis TaxID=433657 RepID=A0ABN2XSI5_9ACTN
MRRTRGRTVEVASLTDLDRRLAAGATSMRGWHLHDLDLRTHEDALAAVDVAGVVLVACTVADQAALQARGAVVLPRIPDVPVDTGRSSLYTGRELYDASSYADSLDARTYAWSRLPADRERSLARALHDHAVDGALLDWVRGRHLVGVMGGHALVRGSEEYAAAAYLGRALGVAHVVATGGGPGAMEAANLGALTARSPAALLERALGVLASVPSYRPDVAAWVAAAFAVTDLVDDDAGSTLTSTLGIPTWHYGHEPSNVFATAIAKYFRNSTREAILLEVCDVGIVFLPGAAGTVQEVFQDACENYYADPASVAPMVLVGREHWTERLPAWPLLEALARERTMESRVHLVDSPEEAAAVIATR